MNNTGTRTIWMHGRVCTGDSARPYLERALAIFEAAIPDHPNTATVRRNLANLLAKITE